MTVDRYTKAVLTVIALALVWIAASLTTVPSAVAAPEAAQQGVVDVRRFGGQVVAPVKGGSGSEDYAIPVYVVNSK